MDADDCRPPNSIAKMRAGQLLDDEDCADWLVALRARLAEGAVLGHSAVLGFPALKQAYRD